jgi:hypothetical protein
VTHKVHHQTERGARIVLAEAKELGREGGRTPPRVAAVGRGHADAGTGQRGRHRRAPAAGVPNFERGPVEAVYVRLRNPHERGTFRPWS